mmetsp:Transcript_34408/g.113879  ORF Transcript_34408/g.113879 Transcript_34408/m.113879 type:complete len:210 (+) Transcript_34408:1339-1968(+)
MTGGGGWESWQKLPSPLPLENNLVAIGALVRAFLTVVGEPEPHPVVDTHDRQWVEPSHVVPHHDDRALRSPTPRGRPTRSHRQRLLHAKQRPHRPPTIREPLPRRDARQTVGHRVVLQGVGRGGGAPKGVHAARELRIPALHEHGEPHSRRAPRLKHLRSNRVCALAPKSLVPVITRLHAGSAGRVRPNAAVEHQGRRLLRHRASGADG